MEQQKTAVFVGGAHAVGKTFLCQQLVDKHGWMFSKQRHVLIEIGFAMGLLWEEVALDHDKLIGEVSKTITERFKRCRSSVLLIDCHYAIRTKKALRLNGRKVDEEYIHDLDLCLVAALRQQFRTKFVLVVSEPSIVMARLKCRPSEFLDQDHTLKGHFEQSKAEREFLLRILEYFQVPYKSVLFVNNSHGVCDTLYEVESFCLSD